MRMLIGYGRIPSKGCVFKTYIVCSFLWLKDIDLTNKYGVQVYFKISVLICILCKIRPPTIHVKVF